MATKIIGTLGGADFTSYSAWLSYLQTLGTLAAPETGQQQNCEMVLAAGLTLSGFTPTASAPLLLTTVAGASFRDQVSPPGSYDPTRGAAIKHTTSYDVGLTVNVPYATVEKLQVLSTNTLNQGTIYLYTANGVAQDCILQGAQARSGYAKLKISQGSSLGRRLLVIEDNAATSNGVLLTIGAKLYSSTVIRPSNYVAAGVGIQDLYNPSQIDNCVIAGFSTPISNPNGSTGTNNATDAASLPAGFTASQVSLVQGTEFVNPTTAGGLGAADFRLVSTSVKSKDNAANDNTNAATDIYGTARPQPAGGSPDIGAHEYAAAGGSVALAGAAVSRSSASGVLTVDVGLAGLAAARASANGDLTATAALAGIAAPRATAMASLDVAVALAGLAAARASAGGSLGVAGVVALAGSAVSRSLATGVLGVAVPLRGAAVAGARTGGVLSAAVALDGAARGKSTVAGDLAVHAALSGAARSVAGAAGGLAVMVPLDGAALARSSASGVLSLPLPALDGWASFIAPARGAVWRQDARSAAWVTPRRGTRWRGRR